MIRIALDRTRCQGYGNCVSAGPDLFDLGEDGIAVVLIDHPSAEREEAARKAARVCPVAAIAILEEGSGDA